MVREGMEGLGILVAAESNSQITSTILEIRKVKILVTPTNEEMEIAKQASILSVFT